MKTGCIANLDISDVNDDISNLAQEVALPTGQWSFCVPFVLQCVT